MKKIFRFAVVIPTLLLLLTLAVPSLAAALSPEVSWVFGNNFTASYILQSFAPVDSGLGTTGAANPTLTLRFGKRYQVQLPQGHPFEVLAMGKTSGEDIILLSMATTGSFESDTEVAWVDEVVADKLLVTFTLTQGLYNAMTSSGREPGYRCNFHPGSMRGKFTVAGVPLSNPIPAIINKGTVRIELKTVVSGLAAPLDLKPAPNQAGRLFVLDQTGKVYIIQNGEKLPEPFLDISDRLVSPLGVLGTHNENDYDERGLLGMAFHPDFANQASPGAGKFYTYTTEPVNGSADFTTIPLPADKVFDHQNVVAEWQIQSLDPNKIDLASRREIMRVDHPQFNHNGGMLAFGPDGFLYISMGDGGEANDVGDGHGLTGNGQNKETMQGSILRINPLAPALTPASPDPVALNQKYRIPADNPFVGREGLDEIFAYGLRNPWRFSFDSLTGQLIVGDVGQNRLEEIDIVQSGGNYGWHLKEGKFRFDPATGNVSNDSAGLPAGLIDPVVEYDHDEGTAIVGGYVFRKAGYPDLAGKYVFGDFSRRFDRGDGRLFYADLNTGVIREFIIGGTDGNLNLFLKGFGMDGKGDIYVLASSSLGPYGAGGVVLKMVIPGLAGDINLDGQSNLTDVISSLHILAGVTPAGIVDYTNEINGDEKNGLEEALFLLRSVVRPRQ